MLSAVEASAGAEAAVFPGIAILASLLQLCSDDPCGDAGPDAGPQGHATRQDGGASLALLASLVN